MRITDKVMVGAMALALPLIMLWEGYSATPYYDIAGVLTNCYGNTIQVENRTYSQAECKHLLETDVGKRMQFIYNDVPDIPIHVLAAGTSLFYNAGMGAYRSSTFRKLAKQGDWYGACHQIPRWVYVTKNGKREVSRGLVNRRKQELELCLQYQT